MLIACCFTVLLLDALLLSMLGTSKGAERLNAYLLQGLSATTTELQGSSAATANCTRVVCRRGKLQGLKRSILGHLQGRGVAECKCRGRLSPRRTDWLRRQMEPHYSNAPLRWK